MTRARVIGLRGALPWNVPDEYRQFLSYVTGQTVVMGRRSWEIFGEDLREVRAIVVSRTLKRLQHAELANSLDGALALARRGPGRLFVAGGAQIYQQALPAAEEMMLSTIDGEFEGDAYFPEFDRAAWEILERRRHDCFEFVHYRRIGQSTKM